MADCGVREQAWPDSIYIGLDLGKVDCNHPLMIIEIFMQSVRGRVVTERMTKLPDVSLVEVGLGFFQRIPTIGPLLGKRRCLTRYNCIVDNRLH
jgi:hypothetical protein